MRNGRCAGGRCVVGAAVVAGALVGGGEVAAQSVVDVSPAATVAEPFTRIRGVAELPGGALLVADQTESAVYRIGADGSRDVLGRTGSGPGEYRDPVGLLRWAGDSVLISDLQNSRFVVVSAAGVLGRVFPQVSGADEVIPQFGDAASNLYFDRVIDVRLRKRSGERVELAPLVRKAPAGALDTVAQLTIPGPPNPNAFPAWDRWAVGRSGAVAIVRNQAEYRVDWVLPDGRVVRGTAVPDAPLPVTSADREAWQSANGGRGMRSTMSMGGRPAGPPPPIEFPDHFPPAASVHVTDDGRALVVRHGHVADDRQIVDVFDGAGRRTARLRLPAGRRLAAVGASLFAIRTDDDGFQWLERYVIP